MTDTACICQLEWDHAIGCPDSHADPYTCFSNCRRRPYRMYEQWCPVHGVFATGAWPDSGTRFMQTGREGDFL